MLHTSTECRLLSVGTLIGNIEADVGIQRKRPNRLGVRTFGQGAELGEHLAVYVHNVTELCASRSKQP